MEMEIAEAKKFAEYERNVQESMDIDLDYFWGRRVQRKIKIWLFKKNNV